MRYGILSSVGALALAGIVIGLKRLADQGTIPRATINVEIINGLAAVCKYAVPALAVIGLIAALAGWSGWLKDKDPHTGFRRLRRWSWWLGRILLVLNTAACLVLGLTLKSDLYILEASHGNLDCKSGLAQTYECTLRLTNNADSTVPFNWKASSIPPGVIIQPNAGSLEPGQTSEPITIVGAGCQATFVFRDEARNVETRVVLDRQCSSNPATT